MTIDPISTYFFAYIIVGYVIHLVTNDIDDSISNNMSINVIFWPILLIYLLIIAIDYGVRVVRRYLNQNND